MNAELEALALLEPVEGDEPCGENLEDSSLLSDLSDLRLFGQARSPEALPEPVAEGQEPDKVKPPPDWSEVKANSIRALKKSKDLRPLAYLGAALLRTDGLLPFLDTLSVASQWLETHWDGVYPRVDEEDAIKRVSALNCLADRMAIVDKVWRTAIVVSRQHGRFSLRDIDLASGQAAPRKDEAKPDEGAIDAALSEMPLDELTTLEQNVVAAVTALNNINSKMRSERGSEEAPDLDPLAGPLNRLRRVLRGQLAARESAGTGGPVDTVASPGEAAAVAYAGGAVKSRQDAIRALDAVSEFFRRNEPSSPIPLFLDRAKRLVSKSYLEVLADIAPDAVTTARGQFGLRDE